MPRKASSPRPVEIERSSTPLILAVLIVVGIGITAGIITWASRGGGQIDVSAKIASSQDQAREAGGDQTAPPIPVPSSVLSSLPNGGLVPQPEQPAPPAEAPAPATDGATSTATSTDGVGEQGDASADQSSPSENTQNDEGSGASGETPTDPGTPTE